MTNVLEDYPNDIELITLVEAMGLSSRPILIIFFTGFGVYDNLAPPQSQQSRRLQSISFCEGLRRVGQREREDHGAKGTLRYDSYHRDDTDRVPAT